MTRQDDTGKKRTDSPEKRDAPERTVAPPIEREHETYEGVIEEDERREQDRERT